MRIYQIIPLLGLSRAQPPLDYDYSVGLFCLGRYLIISDNYVPLSWLLRYQRESTIVYRNRTLTTHYFLFYQYNAKVHDIGVGRTSDQQVIEVLKKGV